MSDTNRFLLNQRAINQLRADHDALARTLMAHVPRTWKQPGTGGGGGTDDEVLEGIATSVIDPRNGTTAGLGFVQPQEFDLAAGTWSDSTTFPNGIIANPYSVSVPVDTWVQFRLTRTSDTVFEASYMLITADCDPDAGAIGPTSP